MGQEAANRQGPADASWQPKSPLSLMTFYFSMTGIKPGL